MGNNSIVLLSLVVVVAVIVLGHQCNCLETAVKAPSTCEKAEREKLLKVCVTDRIPKDDVAISGSAKRTEQELRSERLLKVCCDRLKGFGNDDVAGKCLCTAYKLAKNVAPLLGEIDAVDLCNLNFSTPFECDDDD